MKKITRRAALLVFLLAMFNPVHAQAAIWGYIIAAAGAVMDKLSAKQHDGIIVEYADSILSAIYEVNLAIDGLKQTTCNIYKHEIYQNFAAFGIHLSDYASRTQPELFIADLVNLQWYITDIRKNFEDHKKVVDCGIDQHQTYQLYLAIANIDMNLQYEYISMIYKIAYLSGPDGTLNDISSLDPATRSTLEQLVENDSQFALRTRVSDILNHVVILDGSAALSSWKQLSDARFSGLNSYWRTFDYVFDNVQYVVEHTAGRGWIAPYTYTETVRVIDNCSDWMFPFSCLPRWPPIFTWPPKPPSIINDPTYFKFLLDSTEQSYFASHPDEVYGRHKFEAYMVYVKGIYAPGVPLVKSWVNLIKDGSITYPQMQVDLDIAKHIVY